MQAGGPDEPRELCANVVRGRAGWPYVPGLLALREGPVLEEAVRELGSRADVVLVNGTGRDHPRGAGIALHLGAALDVPTVGVTDRPLVATGSEPGPERGDTSPLTLGATVVGAALRTRRGARPVFVHAGWRTDVDVAREIVLLVAARARTPEPVRRARRLVRVTRAVDEGRSAAQEP
jgi:deoxyribonuclease V